MSGGQAILAGVSEDKVVIPPSVGRGWMSSSLTVCLCANVYRENLVASCNRLFNQLHVALSDQRQ